MFKKDKFATSYSNALEKVMTEWLESSPKWAKIKEILNFWMKVDPINCAWDFTWRKFNFKYLTAELIWYLLDWLNVDFIWEEAKIWKWIANEQWEVNSNYWFLTMRDNTVNDWDKNISQYQWSLQSLIKDKDTRQAIIHYNQPKHQHKWVKDFVCTMYNQFFIRDNKLHMCSYMRSNDAFFWMSYDTVWFSLIQQSMFLDLKKHYPDLELWDLYYNATSFHIYESFFEKSNVIVENKEEAKNINIELTKSFTDFYNNIEDLKVELEDCKNIFFTIKELPLEEREDSFVALLSDLFWLKITKES